MAMTNGKRSDEGGGEMGGKLEELEGSALVQLPSGMLWVSFLLDSGSLKVGQGCLDRHGKKIV